MKVLEHALAGLSMAPRLLPGCPRRPWLDELTESSPQAFGNETRDSRGRVRVCLGQRHRFANSAGWQYRYRLIVAYELGRLPRKDEHVHHKGPLDQVEDLELLLAEYHGALHAYAVELAGYRATDGRFTEHADPVGPFPWPRYGAVLGPAARDEAVRE